MINVTNERQKLKILRRLTLMQNKIEASYEKRIRSQLQREYLAAATLVERGKMTQATNVPGKNEKNMAKVLKAMFLTTAKVFSEHLFMEVDKAVASFQVKTPLEDFWAGLTKVINEQTLTQAKNVSKTTKDNIKKIIEKGLAANESNAVIAKKVQAAAKAMPAFRARRIVRTEVHNAMTFSTNRAAEKTGIMKKKEWVAANDSRTRVKNFNHLKAHGERVKFDEEYIRTGEPLRYPGDMLGSSANIINCRCVELYHTR